MKRKIAYTGRQGEVDKILAAQKLNTVCAEAKCPNRGECFSRGSAAFLILGQTCTRNCSFCGVNFGTPEHVDIDEGKRLAEAAAQMKLSHIVVTSVTRDDLDDGGASSFADAIKCVREKNPQSIIEVLIPDFWGSHDSLMTVLDARPDILNHNIETVARLYPTIRPQAIYERSLELLRRAADDGRSIVKSGFMVGLGESVGEVENLLRDLKDAGCSMVTIGQYLRPSKNQIEVAEFVTPERFLDYEKFAVGLGFDSVMCAPYVRSSYIKPS